MAETERRRGAKYMEGYLDCKESSKWVNYWAVIRGSQVFFFKDPNTQIAENIQGHVDIGPNSSFVSSKSSKGKFEFEVKADSGKKYLFRASSELLRLQWIHTLGLAAQGKTPPPLSVANPEAAESPKKTEKNNSAERKISNQYSEVPHFNISSGAADRDLTDGEMQKTLVKKHNSFSSHCKKLLGRKKSDILSKGLDAEESRQPVTEGAEAVLDPPLYDTFPDDKPPWFFGKISREQAETVLQKQTPGRFLVRDSESVNKTGAFTLSIKHSDRCRHHKIETFPDGNLVIKGHEDKTFHNLATLMKYFAKSQEKEIRLLPVICEEQGRTTPPANDQHIQPATRTESYEIMDPNDVRPPIPGCEDRLPSESSSGSTSPRHPTHGYENLPNKPRAKPPLKSRATEPVLPTYKNLPPKEASTSNRSPPMSSRQTDSYEPMASHGYHSRDSSVDGHKPSLPPKQPVNPQHGYENLPEKGAARLPPRQPTSDGYVNLPPKTERSASDPPGLPPRHPCQNKLGYENVPSSDRGLPPTSLQYQNLPPGAPLRHSYGTTPTSPSRHGPPPPMRRSVTLPAHIIQNTLGQMNLREEPY